MAEAGNSTGQDQALAAGGARLIGWNQAQKTLEYSACYKLKWIAQGKVHQVISLAGDADRIYRLSGQGREVAWRRQAKPQWEKLGFALEDGSLAAGAGVLFLALPATGEILRPPVR